MASSPVGIDPFITELWDSSIIPTLCEYIKIPNLSPDFDADCLTNGHMEAAFALIKTWVEEHLPVGAKVVLHEEPGKRTPFLHVDIAPFKGGKGHSLLYQHLDKQPWMRPWADGLDPTTPVIRGDKLYGRGGADDGYGIFASITAILDVQRRGLPHGHLSVVVEGAEESCRPCVPALVEHKGVPNPEPDLEYWIEKLKPQFGPIDLVICLDSGAATYDTMWLTDALRGVGAVKVEVEVGKESIHSGLGGGVVPDPVRILRILLERIEDTATGAMKVKALNVDIPDSVIKNLAPFKEIPNKQHMQQFTFLDGAHPGSTDNVELMLKSTWKPSVTVIGFDGCPSCAEGGNVIRPSSAMKLSVRIPPMADPMAAEKELKEILEADPPYGCKVTVTTDGFCAGWKAPTLSPWLEKSLHRASNTAFGKPFGAFGCGGSIPFMGMLHDMFKEANFCITGVLGPESNAHGPNEFLHIPFAKGITSCISTVLEDHQNQE